MTYNLKEYDQQRKTNIAINKKELYNEIFESKQKAEELYQVLLIKYYKTYTSVKMTEL